MRPERFVALLVAASLVAGCKSVDDWSGLKRRKETAPVAVADDGQIVADYLQTLDRLGRGGAAEQAEIVETARSAYLAEPSTQRRLRYAFVLAVPGHAASDPTGARALLGEALATPETMLPSERALADLMVLDLDARLSLARENETLRSGSNAREDNRIAELNRRLQAETAEKDRLRRELERAEAKLEAIATLEGGTPPPRP
jgi:cell division septum initiation protein DivIVA